MTKSPGRLLNYCWNKVHWVPGCFFTHDCRATYEELKAKGVKFKSEPREQFYGIEAVVTDDCGNWFSMTQPKQP